MNYLAVAVLGTGVLGLFNLWLMLALARRLRELRDKPAWQAPPDSPRPVAGLPPGTPVPEFSVTTVSGTVISAADLRGERSLIGFLVPGCKPCHNQLPAFIALARSLPGGPGNALAVITNGGPVTPEEADLLIAELAEAGAVQIVTEPQQGPAATALAIKGYPSFVLLGADGRVEASAHGIPGLGRVPAAAGAA